MIKRITKVGNSNGIMFDAAMMELAHLKTGDEVNVEIHAGGTMTLAPIRPRLSRGQVTKAIKSTLKDYARTMKRLGSV
jgi:antitoxin component of MazEF toxin-antitoxin module